jgi:hypothetical protein
MAKRGNAPLRPPIRHYKGFIQVSGRKIKKGRVVSPPQAASSHHAKTGQAGAVWRPVLSLPLAAGLPPLGREKKVGFAPPVAALPPPQTLHQPLKGGGTAPSPWSGAER